MSSPQVSFNLSPSSSSCEEHEHDDSSKSRMADAYNLGSRIARSTLNEEEKATLDSMSASDILVVPGCYDHIHQVLESMGVAFTTVDAESLVSYDLRPDQTVYVNCGSGFPRAAAKKLAGFVEGGGQLITTDWALKNVLEVGFPNTVESYPTYTGDEVVEVQVEDPTNELVTTFLQASSAAAPQWWLEGSSYPIKILDKERVKVLIRSDELGRRFGGCSPVLVTFDYGLGTVVHMISHFYLQRSETRQERHKTSASTFLSDMAVSNNADAVESAALEDIASNYRGNYGEVQSATTSSAFVYKSAIRQKTRNASKREASSSAIWPSKRSPSPSLPSPSSSSPPSPIEESYEEQYNDEPQEVQQQVEQPAEDSSKDKSCCVM